MFKIEHNIETGEISQIELTAEEIAELEDLKNRGIIEAEKLAAKAAEKAAILAKLGITDDEAKLLLS